MPLAFEALVRAHGFMKTERPPEMWEADTDDVRFLPLLGEMIAAGIGGGSPLGDLTLNVSNVVVFDPRDAIGACERTGSADAASCQPPPGEFVAVTVRGRTDLGPDQSWSPSRPLPPGLLLGRLGERLVEAGARYAYVRRTPGEGSVTVFLKRWS